MIRGGLTCLVGITITGVTYLEARGPRGGAYTVAWGAIVFGAFRFFQGYSRRIPPRADEVEYEALAEANRLETQGRTEEALVAYQKIIESHPNTGAGHDAQKSLESLKARRG
jgi:hypothetical protein